MSLKETLDNHPVLIYGAIAAISFGIGWTSYGQMQSVSGRTSVSVERAKQLETYEQERERLVTRIAALEKERSALLEGRSAASASAAGRSELADAQRRVSATEVTSERLRAELSAANDRITDATRRLAEAQAAHQREAGQLRQQISTLESMQSTSAAQAERLRQELAQRNAAPPPAHSAAQALAPAAAAAGTANLSVQLGKVVRTPDGLTVSLSGVNRDGDGRRSARFYLNGKETDRTYAGQRAYPSGENKSCFLEVLFVDDSSARFDYVCKGP